MLRVLKISTMILASIIFTTAASVAPVMAQTARPDLAIDAANLPPMPPPLRGIMENEGRTARLIGGGVGALAGVTLVQIASGGLLLAPLGISFMAGAAEATVAAGAAAPAGAAMAVQAGYSLTAQVLSVFGVAVSGVIGGYFGLQLAQSIASVAQ